MKIYNYVSCLMTFVNSFTLLSLAAIGLSQNVNPGDLLFQDLDCAELCDAIEDVTQGINGARLSHIGIIVKDRALGWAVIEALPPKVRMTKLKDVLSRKNSKSFVGHPHLKPHQIIKVIASATKYMGRPYDGVFRWEDEKLYCSELVSLVYEFDGKKLFEPQPMTYKKPGQDTFHPVWEKYFADLKIEVPEGELGINPGGISRSKHLTISYPWGKPTVSNNKP